MLVQAKHDLSKGFSYCGEEEGRDTPVGEDVWFRHATSMSISQMSANVTRIHDDDDMELAVTPPMNSRLICMCKQRYFVRVCSLREDVMGTISEAALEKKTKDMCELLATLNFFKAQLQRAHGLKP
jgi:hypothetical protein